MAIRKRKRPDDATADDTVEAVDTADQPADTADQPENLADQPEDPTDAGDDPAEKAADEAAEKAVDESDSTGEAESDPSGEAESKSSGDAESEPPGDADEPDLQSEPEHHANAPVSPRTGWVVAAFLLFWPLAIPALRSSVRASEANGAGRHEEARKQSLRTLDLSLGGVCVGGFTILALVLAVALAPTYVTPAMAARAEGYVPAGLLRAITGYPPSTPSSADPLPESAGNPTGGTGGTSTGRPGQGTGLDDPTGIGGLGDGDAPADGTGSVGPVDPEGTKIPDLEVGDCFDTDGIEDATVLYTVRVVPCTTAHGAEVFAETTVDDRLGTSGRAPSPETLSNAAHEYCLPEFEAFVGAAYGTSSLLYWPIVPSEESWATGDRRVACVVESEQDVRRSQEGVGR
ncbi:septum formation family protein [Antribacter gilvus]|uniref:septum formation family protein n=1 Tax=Antribacter gilvus TaxID=2304675 RepID=UPI000F7A175E|nr:septum formation family protein [Antribacter gilvus]